MINRALLLFVLLFLATPAVSADSNWEYRVVYLPFDGKATSVDPAKIEVRTDGSAVDLEKARILNSWAVQGWEIFAVVGNPGVHAVYLRRKAQR